MTDILDAVQSRVALKKSSEHKYVGICPFHEEETGSFTVCTEKQEYHCFGCGAKGSPYAFIQNFNETRPVQDWTPEEMQEKCDEMVLACRERGLNITCIPYQSEEDINVLNRFLISRSNEGASKETH